MIRYALICDNAHDFDSWFPSSDSFEGQSRRGLVACSICGSARVERAIMAPMLRGRIAGAQVAAPVGQPVAAAAPAAAPAALMGETEIAFRTMLAELHRHVTETAEHVGPRFAEEAVRIHHGESESRPIYGEATSGDARMLHEEGIDFLPLPRLPQSGH